jgi:isochorismate hydrolase
LDKNQGALVMRIERERCAGLVIDIQERLFPHMEEKEKLLRKSLILIEGLKILEVPLYLTEQYPKGLGLTLEPIREAIGGLPAIEKATFSCCDEQQFLQRLENSEHNTLIICGIEAHVCVLQTVVDLVASGYAPVVVVDCISSRNMEDKRVAIQRMQSEGAVLTTCESILFELARVSGTTEFKAISHLVK